MKASIVDDPSMDTFTRFVLKRIDPDIIESLTEEQFAAIHKAVKAATPIGKHPVHLRGVIPLYFARYYFVLLMGRDRRQAARQKDAIHRKEMDLVGTILFWFFMLVPLLVLLAWGLYELKVFLGIDIDPQTHVQDLWR